MVLTSNQITVSAASAPDHRQAISPAPTGPLAGAQGHRADSARPAADGRPGGLRLHDFLDFWAREQPHAEFAVQGDRRLTYHQAQLATNRLANAIVNTGLQRGDRVAVLAKNCIEYALLYVAASKAGVVPVPLNYRSAPAEWAYVIDDAGAKLLIAAGPYLSAVDAVRGEVGSVEHFLALGAAAPVAGWEDVHRWAGEQPSDPPERFVGADDVLYQIYTSGTTGHPKGAVLSQQAVVANLVQIGLSAHRGAPGERSLVVAPMLHAAVVWSALAPLSWGGSLYILEDFDAAEVVRILSEERIGYAVLVPTIIQTCLTTVPDIAERAYPSLRLIHTGSAPIAEQTLLGARAAFRCDVVHAYGLTEGTAALTAMAPADYERALADRPELLRSAGRALIGTELRIVDEDGRPMPTGAVGEIVARGPQLMHGYWKQADATAEVFRGGWLHTGDVGVLDADGYLYIRDRLKDVIVTGGLKVYPRMVERVLLEHPAVAEVAVIGVPDARWGESVKAVVVLRPSMTATEPELVDFCRDKLGGFQRPRSVRGGAPPHGNG
jgi:acyl-CoA synthetase (AMP-forming)/AMP-acid ligase II